ncbi:hypothetical protein AK830_g5725 [Neonectria ditissima]|uniref:Mg2+ transporter protein, CorA-like/Zinc transport protein ZntB n=1 Tax=Neonectria ditissima TaxID=78410 RepID=A0A0P7B3C0_9HYPO|nr:hypothetical protein AK830_g5725 [Neonectria ditissima]
MAKKNRRAGGAQDEEAASGSYELPWPSSQRWNPRYDVPRNSTEDGTDGVSRDAKPEGDSRAWSRRGRGVLEPAHWLETLSELYMNDLDRRARWDPRWLSVTRRERFEGMESASVSVVDYLSDDTVQRSELSTSKNGLAVALEARPENSQVRVIMVSDLSRFVMGALGQLYSVDPEFWFEHLVNSSYSANDSGLKLKNAVWLNWVERETRFRHHALPGVGQRTEWNLPRRTRSRNWAHIRWGRLGLLHYLGREGFHEDEIEKRIADGRWTVERDVVLDPNGLLMTQKRQARADKKAKKRKRKQKAAHAAQTYRPQKRADGTSARFKTTNVYRAYSTFQSLPRNPGWWSNRDLRVLAPEGSSYWSSVDEQGKKTIILVFDPMRRMRHGTTKEETPSLTFMPRAMEVESYTEDELRRTPDLGETYLDPPPLPITKSELRRKKEELRKQHQQERKARFKRKLRRDKDDPNAPKQEDNPDGYQTDSSYTSDSELDEEYEQNLRSNYRNPRFHVRERDFARKYSLSTFDLVYRHISTIPTSQLLKDDSLIPAVLTSISLDDHWQLLGELRLVIDQIDADLGADLHVHLVESFGVMTRQNVAWIRSSLQELVDWVEHLGSNSKRLAHSSELAQELEALTADLRSLQTRADQTLNLLVASTSLSQSSLVIDQTAGINKITELAFFFVPLSFITSVFSMQVRELTDAPPRMWTWGLALAVVFLTTYLVRSTLRSPSVRVFAMQCRVVMLNRFTPAHARSSSRQLNTVGNRAIVQFVSFFVLICLYGGTLFLFFVLYVFMATMGIWLGVAGTALYFIVTRWPEAAVLVPCFISIAVAAVGMAISLYWSTEITDVAGGWAERALEWFNESMPSSWIWDAVDDDDLATEGLLADGGRCERKAYVGEDKRPPRHGEPQPPFGGSSQHSQEAEPKEPKRDAPDPNADPERHDAEDLYGGTLGRLR